jgi:hypothetical protein
MTQSGHRPLLLRTDGAASDCTCGLYSDATGTEVRFLRL